MTENEWKDSRPSEPEETVILGDDGSGEETNPAGVGASGNWGSQEDVPRQYIPTPEEQAAQQRAEREQARYERERYRQEQYGGGAYGPDQYGAGAYDGAAYGQPGYSPDGYGKPVTYGRAVPVASGSGSPWTKILLVLFIVAAGLAGVFFLMWRSSEQAATRPRPTVTVTTTSTTVRETTKTAIPGQGILEDLFGVSEPSSDTGATGAATGADGDVAGAYDGGAGGTAPGTGGGVEIPTPSVDDIVDSLLG